MGATGDRSKLTNSAAYMRLIDRGTVSDQLVSATSPVAQKVKLHVFNVENGVYGMHPVSGLGSAPVQFRRSLKPAVRM
jgi:copper(I)-binding protein